MGLRSMRWKAEGFTPGPFWVLADYFHADHHVSAILAKLGVSSRLEAVRRARDLSATA